MDSLTHTIIAVGSIAIAWYGGRFLLQLQITAEQLRAHEFVSRMMQEFQRQQQEKDRVGDEEFPEEQQMSLFTDEELIELQHKDL
jgi:hypothetical protein